MRLLTNMDNLAFIALILGGFPMSPLRSTETEVTCNQRGRSVSVPNEIMQEFIHYSSPLNSPVLDVGAAFGVATLEALKKGAIVIANDIDQNHLNKIYEMCPENLRSNLILKLGNITTDLDFEEGSLSAILCSQVLHFLKGEELEKVAHMMYQWLKPGGKIFSISGTAYAKNIQNVVSFYEERKSQEVRWPGEIENIHTFSIDETVKELPDFFHVLDDEVLKRTFEAAGFVIEKCIFFARKNIPDYIKLDGRENVILIAKKR